MFTQKHVNKCSEQHYPLGAKKWKAPKCPSADEWIIKMWYTYTTEYYSAKKRNEVLICHATK